MNTIWKFRRIAITIAIKFLLSEGIIEFVKFSIVFKNFFLYTNAHSILTSFMDNIKLNQKLNIRPLGYKKHCKFLHIIIQKLMLQQITAVIRYLIAEKIVLEEKLISGNSKDTYRAKIHQLRDK